jgi:hypothetical protein
MREPTFCQITLDFSGTQPRGQELSKHAKKYAPRGLVSGSNRLLEAIMPYNKWYRR